MADNKSFYRRAVEYLQAPPKRLQNTQVKRGPLDKYEQVNGSVWGYNTESGYFPQKLIDDLGDGLGNSAVVACLNVLATSFAEPMLKVYKKNDKGKLEQQNHPLEILFQRPNEFISGAVLSHYIVTSLCAHGDAFLMKVKDRKGNVVNLVPLMPSYVKVRGNTRELITHYEYYAVQKGNGFNDEYIEIPRENLVHIRQGMDPDDHRRGFSPLRSVMRELAGDEAAGQFAVALLHNMAVPGVILSPKDDTMGGPTREEAEGIAQSFKSKFAGANRGSPMIMTGAMDVQVVSFTPEQMNLTALRRLPEERVSSVLGVPAILAGLGAGLDAATYNNTKELREFFTEQKMIPMWSSVAAEVTHQLLHKDFEEDDYQYFCAYDLDQVRALATDKKEQVLTMNSGVQGGFVTISEARQALGLDVDESHDIYLRPLNMVPVPEGSTGIMTVEDETEPAPQEQEPEIEDSPEDQIEDELEEQGKATLNTQSFRPEVRRSRIRRVRRKVQSAKLKDMEVKAKDKITNFPSSGDNQKISMSNSKFKQFPDHNYVKNLKENYPSIWRRAGNGGNPPTSFTGNDAYRNWTKYKAGDRSPAVLAWVKRRESFMARHEGNTRLNGIIAVMKWGGVTKSGVGAMKKIVNEQKKKDDARKNKANEMLAHRHDLTS